jgi:trigger factor
LELPEFDDDFVQTMGNYESVEDFRTAVEERMKADHEDSYNEEYINEILEEITEKTKLSYPPQMLEHEQEHVLDDIKSRLEQQNMDYETYLKLRDLDEEKFIEEEIKPVAKQRLERSLIVDALIKAEGLKLDQEMLKNNVNEIMTEIIYSGNLEEMRKQMGQEEFSRAISMEGVNRTMNTQIQERLKLIATGQPIPEEEDDEDLEEEQDLEQLEETFEVTEEIEEDSHEEEVESEMNGSIGKSEEITEEEQLPEEEEEELEEKLDQ